MTFLKSPVHIQLILTYKCNWNCVFCDLKKRFDIIYPYTHFSTILEKLKEAEVFEVTLYGGEPFLHPDFFEIAERAYKLDFDLNFVSNGTLIAEDNIELIKEYFKSGSLSIHGFEKTHNKLVGDSGAFKKVINSLKLLTENDFPTGVCITITNLNCKELPYLVKYLLDNYNGIYYIALDIFKPFKWKNLELLPKYEDLLSSLKRISEIQKEYPKIYIDLGGCIPYCLLSEVNIPKKSCWAGTLSCTIDPLGNVKICSESDVNLGNIFKESLNYIWENSKILKEYRSLKWLSSQCRCCPMLSQCLGGCKVTKKETFSSDILLDIWKKYRKNPCSNPKEKIKSKIKTYKDNTSISCSDVVFLHHNVKWREDIHGILIKNIYNEYYTLPFEFKNFLEYIQKPRYVKEISQILPYDLEKIKYIIQFLKNLYIVDIMK